jgi:hypothetical protein
MDLEGLMWMQCNILLYSCTLEMKFSPFTNETDGTSTEFSFYKTITES